MFFSSGEFAQSSKTKADNTGRISHADPTPKIPQTESHLVFVKKTKVEVICKIHSRKFAYAHPKSRRALSVLEYVAEDPTSNGPATILHAQAPRDLPAPPRPPGFEASWPPSLQESGLQGFLQGS